MEAPADCNWGDSDMRSRSALLALTMSCCVALSAPALAQCGAARVVGGDDTDITKHSWQVALLLKGGGLCGGAIIDEKWVLTAAHCFDSEDPKEVQIKSGATNYRVGGKSVPVERIVRHKFDENTLENDLALVKLKTRPAGRAIDLAGSDVQLTHCQTTLEVTGWGRTKTEARAQNLQVAKIPYIDNGTCNAKDAHNDGVKPSMMCAGSYMIDACKGDSGGPLVLKTKVGNTERAVLVGIVSWGSGKGCGLKDVPGVYTRVSSHLDWIRQTMKSK
jgi:secreted trypsin-like serine protease